MVAALGALMVGSSGCATILGGIIGHQSGEMCAGMAIGAAVDIVGGLMGQQHEKERKEAAEEAKAVTVYSDMGYIRAGKCLTGQELERKLKDKFAAMSWECRELQDTHTQGDVSTKMYSCRTQQGKVFEMELFREKCEDMRIYVRTPEGDDELRGLITSQVGLWVSEIAR